MFCERCQKNKAALYYKQTINGKTVSWHLCADCANENAHPADAFLNPLTSFGLLTSVFPPQNSALNIKSCPACGTVFGAIMDSGKAGCGECYTVFRDELLPSISSIHGAKTHTGRVPPDFLVTVSKKRKIEELQAALKRCVAEENYETAAQIRDEIRSLDRE